jgi:hypothetical protein
MKIKFSTFAKGSLFVFATLFFANAKLNAQTLLVQDFNATTTVSTYVGTGTNQFDFIGVSAPSGSNLVYASSNRMTIQKYSGGAAIVKSTNLAASASGFLKIKFKINVPFNTGVTAVNTAAVFYVGSSLVASATTTGEPASNAGRHSTLGIGFGSSGKYYLRNLNTFTQTDTLTGEQQITWFVNNNGASINYVDPAGGSSTLADDQADVWVGTTRVFSAIPAVTPATELNNFKVLFNGSSSHGGISFDDFDISTGTEALPVAFSSVKATAVGATNVLTWQTATEINNKGFYIQRRAANGSWDNLGFVKGNNSASSYSFTDFNPLATSFYRLQQIDEDGKLSYSSVVSVAKNMVETFTVSPNPTTDKVIVNFSKASNLPVTATLYNYMGKQVLTQTGRSGTFEVNLSGLPKGSYILSVQSESGTATKTIIRQ